MVQVRNTVLVGSTVLLGLVAVLALSVASCGVRCTVAGCPEDQLCSKLDLQCHPVSEVVGAPCPQGDQDCKVGICLQSPGGPICAPNCGMEDPACPAGLPCLPAISLQSGYDMVCIPPESGIIGEPCSGGEDCGTGLCMLAMLGGDGYCTTTCNPETPAACGPPDVLCERSTNPTTGNVGTYCVPHGDAGVWEPCPRGWRDCDPSLSGTCISNTSGSYSACAPACPGGIDECSAFTDACCQDFSGTGDVDRMYCIPTSRCS